MTIRAINIVPRHEQKLDAQSFLLQGLARSGSASAHVNTLTAPVLLQLKVHDRFTRPAIQLTARSHR